jgi:hypothetical protein
MCNCTSEDLEIPGLVLTHHPGMMTERLEKNLPSLLTAGQFFGVQQVPPL